jgi:hypothetical protein
MTDHRNGFDHVRTLFCLDWRRRTDDWINVISLSLSARAHTLLVVLCMGLHPQSARVGWLLAAILLGSLYALLLSAGGACQSH